MKVLVTGRLPEEILNRIRVEHEVEVSTVDRPMERRELLDKIRNKHGLLCMITDRIDEEVLNNAPELKMIANYGVGYDNIDIAAATARKILVSNTPGVLTDSTADLAFSLILSVARRIVEGDRLTRQGGFRFWAPQFFLGRDVSGKTLGIIGLGQIGRAVAKRAIGFNMRVLYYSRTRATLQEEEQLKITYMMLDNLLSEADFISLHVPLTEKTYHLIGERELNLMKPTAFLINTSRGPVVKEQALVQALKQRVIAGAGLDVYENEPSLTPGLTELENVILLPHIGSATYETRARMAGLAVDNLMDGLSGKKPSNCLNCKQILESS